MPRHELTYPKTPVNKVNRYATIAAYDTKTIHNIVAATPVVHVSFLTCTDPPAPVVLPMIGALGSFENPSASLDEALQLYIHGYVSARMFRVPEEGVAVCVAATVVDGLVLALTPYNNNFNYRSAILHGTAKLITSPAEKSYALQLITEHILPGHWAGSRVPPTKAELDATSVLRVDISSASAKVRVGPPGESRHDLDDPEVVGNVWTGVVPTWTVHGEPVGAGAGKAELPGYVKEAVRERNERAEMEAVGAIVGK